MSYIFDIGIGRVPKVIGETTKKLPGSRLEVFMERLDIPYAEGTETRADCYACLVDKEGRLLGAPVKKLQNGGFALQSLTSGPQKNETRAVNRLKRILQKKISGEEIRPMNPAIDSDIEAMAPESSKNLISTLDEEIPPESSGQMYLSA